jgi:hypothetical protein
MPYEHRCVCGFVQTRLVPAASCPLLWRCTLSSCCTPTRTEAPDLTRVSSVKGRVDGKIVPIPPSQETVNTLFDANVHSEGEMEVSAGGWKERGRGGDWW